MRFIASRAPAAFFAAVALGSGPGTTRPTAFDPPPKTVYAAELAGSSWRLVALDGRTLRHVSGRSLELPGFVTGVRPSPDGRRLALTLDAVGGPASVLVVDTVRLRVLGHVALAREGRPLTVAWTSNRELVAIGGWGSPRTSAFDAGGRVHSVRSLGGTLVAAAASGRRLAALLAPSRGIAPARLVVVDAGGRVRAAALPVAAGLQTSGSLRQVTPGLAVDGAGRRAVVVPAGKRAVSVDLSTLEVEEHALRSHASLVRRLLGWLEGTAEAKAIAGPQRRAAWVGADGVAITGSVGHPTRNGGVRSTTPPLAFVDARTWSIRTVADRAGTLTEAGDLVLAYGGGWAVDRAARRRGLSAFTSDGTRRFRVLRDRYIQDVWRAGRYAYAADPTGRRLAVVDLARGTVIARVKRERPAMILGARRPARRNGAGG